MPPSLTSTLVDPRLVMAALKRSVIWPCSATSIWALVARRDESVKKRAPVPGIAATKSAPMVAIASQSGLLRRTGAPTEADCGSSKPVQPPTGALLAAPVWGSPTGP
jgi:hypothetical protein